MCNEIHIYSHTFLTGHHQSVRENSATTENNVDKVFIKLPGTENFLFLVRLLLLRMSRVCITQPKPIAVENSKKNNNKMGMMINPDSAIRKISFMVSIVLPLYKYSVYMTLR